MKFLTRQFHTRILILLIALFLGFSQQGSTVACNFPLDPPETLTITLGQAFTNPGDTFEIPISLSSESTQPTTLIIWVNYDPTKIEPFGEFYEFIVGVDNDGNSLVTRSIVRPEAPLDSLNITLDTEVHEPEGVIAITLITPGGIPDGHILTLPFQTLPGAQPNDVINIDGVATNEGVIVFVESSGENEIGSSSASVTPSGQVPKCFDIAITDGQVQMACVPTAETPTNVVATQGNPDKVTISWSPIATPSSEYRVYRSTTSNFNDAIPIGPGWATPTSFDDFSALVPVILDAAGCNPQTVEVHYWYWVIARTPAGCEGNFSAQSSEGWRGPQTKQLNTKQAGTTSLHLIIVPLFIFLASLFWKRREPISIKVKSE